MKLLIKISILSVIALSVLIGSCKKQDRCGCDEDIIDELFGSPVYIYYDSINMSARFTPLSNTMATYYFCNPTEMMPKLKKYDNGAVLLVDGLVYWECNYMYQASNNYSYMSYYKSYMITVTDLYENMYGK